MKMHWLTLALVVPLVACDGTEMATTATSTETMTTSPDTADARFDPKAAQATAPPGRVALLQKDVQVTLADHEIRMTDQLQQGQVTFNITNSGAHEHSFEIEGNGIEKTLDRPLQPAQSAKLVVDITAGTYKVYCPVADHEERGMTRALVVR